MRVSVNSIKVTKKTVLCFVFCLSGLSVLKSQDSSKAQDSILTLDKAIQIALANNFGIKVFPSNPSNLQAAQGLLGCTIPPEGFETPQTPQTFLKPGAGELER